jgi:hypothetical protein
MDPHTLSKMRKDAKTEPSRRSDELGLREEFPHPPCSTDPEWKNCGGTSQPGEQKRTVGRARLQRLKKNGRNESPVTVCCEETKARGKIKAGSERPNGHRLQGPNAATKPLRAAREAEQRGVVRAGNGAGGKTSRKTEQLRDRRPAGTPARSRCAC